METATILMIFAGVMVVTAVLLAIFKREGEGKSLAEENAEKAAETVPGVTQTVVPTSVPGAAVSVPLGGWDEPKNRNRKQRNKKGWRAPVGHYFNDRDELCTDAGDLIVDLMIVAELCNEPYDGVVVSAAAPIEENLVPTIEEGPNESAPVVSAPEPVPSYSAPDPHDRDGGGGGGSDNADDD